MQLKNTITRTALRNTDESHHFNYITLIFPYYLNKYLHIIYFNYLHAYHRSLDILLKGKINSISHKAIL